MANKRKGGSSRGPRKTSKAPSGPVRVSARAGYRVQLTRPTDPRARKAARALGATDGERDILLQALAEQELEVAQEFTIGPTAGGTRGKRRGAAAAASGTEVATVDVDVSPSESAVVLVEQDGEFSWHFPEPEMPHGAQSRQAVSATRRAPSTVTIRVRMSGMRKGSDANRRGIGIGTIVSAAKGVVLKFVARTATGVAMKFLERNVKKGLVVMKGDKPAEWGRVETIKELSLPRGEPARILLWVHGTFSSTTGSFGALSGTPEGLQLLRQANEQYDAVIGFDHATLGEDPHENAVDLVERLGRFENAMKIDAVTYSRGGLVLRSMLEEILPTSAKKPEVGSAVFVAVPNSGTLLAEPKNWHVLIDLYTNIAVAAFRLLQLLPTAAPAARILSELISGLGALVKYLADVVVSEKMVPGLAAQEPAGDFVRALNETGDGQPLPATTRYLAITSNFDPKAAVQGTKPTGLAASFLGRLANGLVDQLMKESNDLVVNDGSMKRIDPDAGDYMKDALDFGDSGTVYHTVYFAQPRVAEQLQAWLLEQPTRERLATRMGVTNVRPSAKSPFERVSYREPIGVSREIGPHGSRQGQRSAGRAGFRAAAAAPASMSFEDVARQCLEVLGVAPTGMVAEALAAGGRPGGGVGRASMRRTMAGAAREEGGEREGAPSPTVVHTRTQVSSLTKDDHIHVVSFAQTHGTIPVFGTNAVVELDDSKRLISAHAKLARVDDVSPNPTLSVEQAIAKLIAFSDRSRASATREAIANSTPPLNYFHDADNGTWHLVYVFSDVPALPASWKGKRGKREGHGLGPGPRQHFPRLDYLVDAHDGSIVYYYSVTPTAARGGGRGRARTTRSAKRRPARKTPVAMKALPGRFRGIDDEGQPQAFDGLQAKGAFELVDPQRGIRTIDLKAGDIDKEPLKLPGPVSCTAFDFATSSPAAISAHVNSGHVFTFYNNVLIRRGVDDAGSELVNVVNCVSSASEPPPNWNNAVWWKGKMWYGRRQAGKEKFESYARYLDIIAHELTHGVTETTSNLVYRDQAGALNESFSDIFGVIITNWTRLGAQSDPRKWNWEIGPGLGDRAGLPLRSMKNPRVTGDPDHMDDYQKLAPDDDFGGVHTNSNIHNKAAYNLLTAADAKGLVIPAEDVARLYYFTLQRLDRVATFQDVVDTMLDVAKTVYPDPAEASPKLAAIREAYAGVGIRVAGANAERATVKKRKAASRP
jgi:bacillolysin